METNEMIKELATSVIPKYVKNYDSYKEGDFIDWHTHWPKEKNTWHGFFCVDCEPSYTTYRLPNCLEPVKVTSETDPNYIKLKKGEIFIGPDGRKRIKG